MRRWLLMLVVAFGPPLARAAEEVVDPQTSWEERTARDPARAPAAARRLLGEDLAQPERLREALYAAAAVGDRELLDDAIDSARPLLEKADASARSAFGSALLRRARLAEPVDRAGVEEAERLLADGARGGSPRAALDLAYARHVLADVAGAKAAYEGALDGAEEVADRALAGLESLLGRPPLDAWMAALADAHPANPAVARRLADAVERREGREAALRGLLAWLRARPTGSARVRVAAAERLAALGRLDEAWAQERQAVEEGGANPRVRGAVWAAWRSRPLTTLAACDVLERDARLLLSKAGDDAYAQVAIRNDLAFLLREVVSGFTWRGEARTQGIAEGAPPEVRRLLDRCVALYDEALARIPPDVADRSFGERWVYAGILNDAALMRHYFLDVRDLGTAEALYHRAFELTDGAYMDTYYYNLQYLYGFELPGREETWMRLARRAADRILRETQGGTLEPDERKRDAARRDAEALRARLEAGPK